MASRKTKRSETPSEEGRPTKSRRIAPDQGETEPSRGARALSLLQSLATKVADRHDAEQLLALPEDATKDNACWNFALFGNSNDEAADPKNTFTEQATAKGSPFRNTMPKNPEFGTIVPKRGSAGSGPKQREWHTDVASQVITEAGWRLQEDSPLKIAYQWQPGTAMYQHWELWYDGPTGFVSVAKFPGKPVHAKDSVTDLQAEGLRQVEIGVDPESISDLHLERLTALDGDQAVDIPAANIYG